MARSRSHFQLELPLAADLGIAFSGRQLERGDAGVLVEVMGYDTHGFRVHFLAYQLLSPFSFFFQREQRRAGPNSQYGMVIVLDVYTVVADPHPGAGLYGLHNSDHVVAMDV